jgi:choline dehydrogenase-like flavoprotein
MKAKFLIPSLFAFALAGAPLMANAQTTGQGQQQQTQQTQTRTQDKQDKDKTQVAPNQLPREILQAIERNQNINMATVSEAWRITDEEDGKTYYKLKYNHQGQERSIKYDDRGQEVKDKDKDRDN